MQMKSNVKIICLNAMHIKISQDWPPECSWIPTTCEGSCEALDFLFDNSIDSNNCAKDFEAAIREEFEL
ncbi:hypothetical protein [Salinicoccus albus]|uniref:hypothetical protein n=1 Tax=Salinicoccus albus TaxID=418756 RepID=UPI000368B305|nr:hypothetical protein [Salinicoccus albus]